MSTFFSVLFIKGFLTEHFFLISAPIFNTVLRNYIIKILMLVCMWCPQPYLPIISFQRGGILKMVSCTDVITDAIYLSTILTGNFRLLLFSSFPEMFGIYYLL